MAGDDNSENMETSQKVELVFNDQEKEWLTQSEEFYGKRKYDACFKCIQNLQSSFQKNYQSSKIYANLETKLSMNKNLCDLAVSNFGNLEEFRQELTKICNQINIDISQADNIEDLQHSFVFFNYAILLYYNKQYSDAYRIIEKLYKQFNELLDEKLFRELCFVYIDILIKLKKPLKALNFLQNFRLFQRRSSNTSLNANKANDEKSEESESTELFNQNELTSLFKLKCYFLINSKKAFNKELSNYIDLVQKSNTEFNILKAQDLFLSQNYSSCLKNLIGSLVHRLKINGSNITDKFKELILNDDQLGKLFDNSITNDFYLNLVAASNNLSSTLSNYNPKNKLSEFQDHLSNCYQTILFFNNLAIVHFSLKKYGLSCFYLRKSLNENSKFVEKYLQPSNVVPNQNENKTKKKKAKPLSEKDGSMDSKLSKFLNLNEYLMNNQFEIMYNMGVSLLFNKQPIAAFECLIKLTEEYSQNARLWLRLAECCITCYRHSLNVDSNQFIKLNCTLSGNERLFKLSEKIKCIKKSFGSGIHHKIQIGSSITPDICLKGLSLGELKDLEDDSKLPSLITLEFAYMCLKNAFSLIPDSEQIFKSSNNSKTSPSSKFAESQEDGVNSDSEYSLNVDQDSPIANKGYVKQHQYFNCVYPSKPINLSELQNLRCSILVSLSYISLCLRDFTNTLKYCNILLDINDQINILFPISNGNKFLAHSYMAEAQLYLDKISEAIENLNINARLDSENDISFVPSVGQENYPEDFNDSSKSLFENTFKTHQAEWFPKDLSSIKAFSYYNLSVAHAVRGEIEMALKNFNISVQIFDKFKKHPAQAFLMKMYLDLVEGNRQSLQMILKDHFPHTTMNRVTPSILNSTNNNLNQKNQQQQQQQQQQVSNAQFHQLQQIQNQSQLPPNLAMLQQQQLQLQQFQMQQLQQLQQAQLPNQQPLQNLSQLMSNPNTLLMNSFNNSSSQNLVGLPPAISPFNQTPANLNNLLGQNNNAFGNLSNLNSSNFLSTLAAVAAANNSNSGSSNSTPSQLGNITPNNPLSLYNIASMQTQQQMNPNQLPVNSILMQSQQQSQGNNYLAQNQMPSRLN